MAEELSAAYPGTVDERQVLITADCNQAFCMAVSALGTVGDEVLLPVRFNHGMCLRTDHLVPAHLPVGPISSPTWRQPNWRHVPPPVIAEFAALAARRDIALILEETYRSFRQSDEPGMHDDLRARHRAQEAAIAGLRGALDWRSARALETGAKLDRFRSLMAGAPCGFELQASGAFFGWVRHPFAASAHEVVRALVREQDVALLPGSPFTPSDERYLRFSVAALEERQLGELGAWLWAFGETRGKSRPPRVVSGGPGPCHARPIATVLTKGSAP